MPDIVVKKTRLFAVWALKKFYIIYMKKVYKLTLLVAVEAVTIVSQIFESPNCILMHKDDYFEIWRRFSVWEI